jgi:hypothetical protein
MHPNHPKILEDEWILSEDSNQIPFIDWSMNIQNNEDNFNSISQEFFSEKNNEQSDKTIVSWTINGFFSVMINIK